MISLMVRLRLVAEGRLHHFVEMDDGPILESHLYAIISRPVITGKIADSGGQRMLSVRSHAAKGIQGFVADIPIDSFIDELVPPGATDVGIVMIGASAVEVVYSLSRADDKHGVFDSAPLGPEVEAIAVISEFDLWPLLTFVSDIDTGNRVGQSKLEYLGMTFGKDGQRHSAKRLKSHSKAAQILSQNSEQGREVRILGLWLEETASLFGPTNSSSESVDEFEGRLSVDSIERVQFSPSMDRRLESPVVLNAVENCLISLMKPEFCSDDLVWIQDSPVRDALVGSGVSEVFVALMEQGNPYSFFGQSGVRLGRSFMVRAGVYPEQPPMLVATDMGSGEGYRLAIRGGRIRSIQTNG